MKAKKNGSINKKVLITCCVLLAAIIVADVVVTYHTSSAFEELDVLVQHSNDVVEEAEQIFYLVTDIQVSNREYIITGDSNFLVPSGKVRDKANAHIKKLRTLTAGNKHQQAVIDSLEIFTRKKIAFSQQLFVSRRDSGFSKAKQLMQTQIGKMYVNKVNSAIEKIKTEENDLLAQQKQAEYKNIGFFYKAFGVMVSAIFVLSVMVFRIIINNTKLRQKINSGVAEIADYKYALNESSIVATADQKGIITYVNDHYCSISKYSREELIGHKHRIINSGYKPNEFIPHVWETIAHGKMWNGSLRHKAKDGSIYWVNTTIVPFLDEQGKPYQYMSISADITEKKILEQQQALVTSIVDSSDDAIISKTLDGVITSWNRGAEKTFGHSAQEIIGKRIFILIPPDHHIEEIETVEKILKGEVIHAYESERIKKSGEIFNVSLTVSPIKDLNGNITGASTILRDITADKAAQKVRLELEENVRRKTEELAGILDKILDGFILLDKDFNYTYANKKIGEMTGWDSNSLIGKNVWDVFPDAVNSTTYHAFNRAMKAQQYVCNLDYYEPLDLWQENRIYPTEQGISVFIRDITAQKRAEQTIVKNEKIYKTIATSIPDCIICLFDCDYTYSLLEGNLLEKLGFSKEKLLGNKLQNVVSAERYAKVLPNLEKVFKGEASITEEDRGEYYTITKYVPLKDENDKVYSAMLVVIDITDLKKAQHNIIELNKGLSQKVAQLEVANKELESFSYSVSHDLRAPLRAINGFTKILKEDFTEQFDEDATILLQEVIANSTKMGELIDNLLEFSHVGKKNVSIDKVDIKQLVSSALAEVQQLMPERTVTVNIHQLENIRCDRNMLKQVLINLISNAFKYTGKKEEAIIEIGSYLEDNECIYYVKDNGAGFDMQYAGKLFGVFQRLHSSNEFDGTGVGLAIIKKIISKHEGRVWAEGKVNEGACFYFSLPM